MAHMVDTMAYAGETPWHGLGVKVSNELTPSQMMQKADLDWKVHEVESFVEFNDEKIPTGQKSLVRSSDSKILTNVGPDWKPVQNSEAFEFFSEFVLSGDMEMNTAGSLRDGKMVWALAKVKESFDVFGDDKVDSYLLFSNPHQYGKSIDIRFTPVRVVCNNTLSLSLSGKADRGVRMGHRTQFNPDQVKTTLGLAHEKFAKYKEMALFLGSRKTTAESLIQYYNEVFPNTSRTSDTKVPQKYEELSRNAKLCYDALETQPGAEYAEGSWWQAFNSVTYITDHVQGRNSDNRLHSQWFGSNQARKVTAAESAVEFASAS
jgi:phage/plasmid-like protein (TIGR03299 family)